MKRSQEKSNRAKINDAILAYIMGLPEPKEMPVDIKIEIKYKEGTERHNITLG